MSKFFAIFISTLLATFASYAMLQGSGFFVQSDGAAILSFSVLLLFLSGDKRAFWGILLPISLLYAFYTPIGMSFGAPSYQYVASVFATDWQESKEFFSQIPITHFGAALGIILSIFALRFIVKNAALSFHRNKTFVLASMTLLFFSSAIWTASPAKFLIEGGDALWQVYNELKKLNRLNIPSQWGTSTLSEHSRYDDYVLIIGESARRDYHHAYGYPIENTPFMSQAKGTLINGLTAGGTNTIASLKLMLTQPDKIRWQGDYSLSLIDLVKSAGIRTYWLSNQGYLGTFDTPISSIANKSDETFFTKSGDSFNQNISDFALLPKLANLLAQPANGKRFIVLHLYGSHPLSCDRLTDYPKLFSDEDISPQFTNLNCYISSIKKTDEIVQKVYEQLQAREKAIGRSFSLVYFSDHGLSHKLEPNNIDMLNMSQSQLHFNVPLFKISSDDTIRTEYNAFKSGLNFTEGIGNWIGIQNPKLNPNVDLFNAENHDDYGLNAIIAAFETPLDPAITIKPKGVINPQK